MGHFKSLFGRMAIAVGLVGMILTFVGPVFLWRAAAVVSDRFVRIAELVIEVETKASERVVWAEEVLDTVQGKLTVLKQSADNMSESAERNQDVGPLLRQLDAELVQELGETRALLVSIQAATEKLNQAVKQFDALSSPMQVFKRTKEPSEDSDLSTLSNSLMETSQLIQQVIDFVAKMEEQGITDEQAQRLKQAIVRLGEEMDQGHSRLNSIQVFLQVTRANIKAKRESVPVWTKAGATYFTLLLICIGFTQIQLIGFGRSLL